MEHNENLVRIRIFILSSVTGLGNMSVNRRSVRKKILSLMSFFGGGSSSSSSSSAPQTSSTSTNAKNAVIDKIRTEMAVNTAQNLIEVDTFRFFN